VGALAQVHPQNPHWFNRDRFVLSAGHGSALLYSQPQLSGIILEEQTGLTLTDVCSACAVHAEYIIELVDEGVLVPVGRESVCWRFSGAHMRRVMVVCACSATWESTSQESRWRCNCWMKLKHCARE